MFFDVFFWLMFALPVLGVTLAYFISGRQDRVENTVFAALFSGLLAMICFLVVGVNWSSYADTLSKAHHQQQVIEAQQSRVQSLSARLESFQYPQTGAQMLWNKDAPVASIVESLTDAEDKLAQARDEQAKALREIEAVKRGPFSGVVDFVGD